MAAGGSASTPAEGNPVSGIAATTRRFGAAPSTPAKRVGEPTNSSSARAGDDHDNSPDRATLGDSLDLEVGWPDEDGPLTDPQPPFACSTRSGQIAGASRVDQEASPDSLSSESALLLGERRRRDLIPPTMLHTPAAQSRRI
jgi:hypothetical protein